MRLFWQLFVTVVASTTTSSSSGDIDSRLYKNIVVIPDVHGDINSLIVSLWMALVEIEGPSVPFFHFQGVLQAYYQEDDEEDYELMSKFPTETLVIQLGDLFDRGPYGMQCMKTVGGIPSTIGWPVVRLWGNHELMNHLGTSSMYIHTGERAAWADEFGSASARVDEFKLGGSVWNELTRASLLMARVADPTEIDHTRRGSVSTLFVHGGLDHYWIDELLGDLPSSGLVDHINQKVASDFPSYLEALSASISPLWNRDMAQVSEEYICEHHLPSLLERFKVSRIVIGHTPQRDLRMKTLCEGRIILADSAMSAWMRKTEWTVAEDEGHDYGIVGNPSVYIIKLKANSHTALYWDLANCPTVSSKSGCISRGLDNVPAPTLAVSRVMSGVAFAESLVPVSYTAHGIMQSFTIQSRGALVIEFIHKLKTSIGYGIPRIVTPNIAPGSSNPMVILDTSGRALISFELTPIFVRQIVQLVVDLNSIDVSIGPFRDILTAFIVEPDSGLLKLVDFESAFLMDNNSDVVTSLMATLMALKHSPLNLFSIVKRMDVVGKDVCESLEDVLSKPSVRVFRGLIDVPRKIATDPAIRSAINTDMPTNKVDPIEAAGAAGAAIDPVTLASRTLLVDRLTAVSVEGVPVVRLSTSGTLRYTIPECVSWRLTVDIARKMKRLAVRLHTAGILMHTQSFIKFFCVDAKGTVWLTDLSTLRVGDNTDTAMSLEYKAMSDELAHELKRVGTPDADVARLKTVQDTSLHSKLLVKTGRLRAIEYVGSSSIEAADTLISKIKSSEALSGILRPVLSIFRGDETFTVQYMLKPEGELHSVSEMATKVMAFVATLHAEHVILGTDAGIAHMFGVTDTGDVQLIDMSHLRVVEEGSPIISIENHRIRLELHTLMNQDDESSGLDNK